MNLQLESIKYIEMYAKQCFLGIFENLFDYINDIVYVEETGKAKEGENWSFALHSTEM